MCVCIAIMCIYLLLLLPCSVNPDWGVNTVDSVVVQEWLRGVNASDNDLKLMLNVFEPSD